MQTLEVVLSLLGKIVAQIAHLAVVGMITTANDLVKLLNNTLFHHHDPLVVGVLGLCNSIAKPVSDIRRCTLFVGVSRSVISILSLCNLHAVYHCVHLCVHSPHVAFFSSNLGLDIFVPTRHHQKKTVKPTQNVPKTLR